MKHFKNDISNKFNKIYFLYFNEFQETYTKIQISYLSRVSHKH